MVKVEQEQTLHFQPPSERQVLVMATIIMQMAPQYIIAAVKVPMALVLLVLILEQVMPQAQILEQVALVVVVLAAALVVQE